MKDIKAVQYTVEVGGRGDSEFTRFYSEEKYWEFMENIGSVWDDLNLQSYVDYYSVTHKSYVDWDDLNNTDRAWLLLHNITEQQNF